MEYIICYSILVYGLCVLLIEGFGPYNIIDKFRNLMARISKEFGKMFECFLCTSTNVGWIVVVAERLFGFTISPISRLLLNESIWIVLICNMFFTCGVVWILRNIVTLLEKKIDNE